MPRDTGSPPARDPPRSATRFTPSLAAMGAGVALVWATGPGMLDLGAWLPYAGLVPCVGIVAVLALVEWVWPAPGARASRGAADRGAAYRPRDPRRIAVRVAGLAATLALFAFAYWLLPEYHGDFYAPYWRFLRSVAPLAVLVPVYFWWLDARVADAEDDYLAFGRWVCRPWRRPERSAGGALIRRHLLGWTIKAFFLPLMTVYLGNELSAFHGAWSGASRHVMPLYQVCYHLSYLVDLLYCVVGYSVAIRLFDAQIRSVEPTLLGWLVALVCYQPFYSVIGRYYLQYDDGTFWDNWLQAWPTLQAVWAAAIVLLTLLYALCTVAFGLRFSNLTHRGIITSGPYRFTKHPAYLAKNLSWWLISVPFVSEQGAGAAVRNCLLLGLLNAVYFLRARTEERHLSRDPTYVAYALWMNEHGLFKGLARRFPCLGYRAPPVARAGASPGASG